MNLSFNNNYAIYELLISMINISYEPYQCRQITNGWIMLSWTNNPPNDTSAGGLLVPECIIRPVFSASNRHGLLDIFITELLRKLRFSSLNHRCL
jgi:hypothetical protein